MPMLSSKYTIIGSIILCVVCIWFGYYQGSKHVQILWNQDKLEQAQYINRLQQNYLNKESVYIIIVITSIFCYFYDLFIIIIYLWGIIMLMFK